MCSLGVNQFLSSVSVSCNLCLTSVIFHLSSQMRSHAASVYDFHKELRQRFSLDYLARGQVIYVTSFEICFQFVSYSYFLSNIFTDKNWKGMENGGSVPERIEGLGYESGDAYSL